MGKKVTPPRKKDRVFNDFRRPKLLRKRIPLAEVAAGLTCLAVLATSGAWVAAQRDAYDPSERDLDVALLGGSKTRRELYNLPLKTWQDPALAPSAAAGPDLGPFPPPLAGDGWRAAGRVQTFTPDTLYEKINGQAEQYLKFGFQRLDVLTLEEPGSGAAVDVFLYDQGTFPDSLGLYAEQRGDKPVQSRGRVYYTPTSVGAYGAAGRYVFHVIGTDEGEAVRRKTVQVIDELSTLVGQGALPLPFRVLREGVGLPLGSIGYVPSGAFQLGFAERFWFGTPDPGGTARLFLHRGASPADAASTFGKLHEAQLADFEVLKGNGGERAYRHAFLGTYFLLSLSGDFVLGVEDHPDRAQAAALVESLKAAVRDVAGASRDVVAATPPAASAEPGEDGSADEPPPYDESEEY